MLFGIIILLLIGVIAFFHYLQGLFSATISAFLAIISAVLAVSYQETIISALLKGKVADEANGMVMCLLFAGIYIILRTIFDKAVPGNLRFPAIVDKIGGAAMGVVAGIFATGIVVLAAESMPFGPGIGGYSRYELRKDQSVDVPTDRQMKDSFVYNEVPEDDPLKPLDPTKQGSLLIPVDDIVLATVQHLSDNGSLAGDRTLYSIHPDYAQEMFGARIGIQVGANRSVLNVGDLEQAKLGGLYSLAGISCADPEFKELRGSWKIPSPPVVKPTPSQVLLVARIEIDHNAGDDADKLFRFSTGSIRLVANDKNYFPIGTVDNANILMMQKPDDFIFLDFSSSPQAGLDAAFLVDRSDLFGDDRKNTGTIADGRFIEIKRLARIDLSGKSLDSSYAASPDIAVMRKKLAMDKLKVSPIPVVTIAGAAPPEPVHRSRGRAATPTAPPAETPEATTPAVAPAGDLAKISSTISYKIGVNTSDDNAQDVAVSGGTVSLKDSRLAVVKIDPTAALDKLATGDSQLTDLYVPDGKKVVQMTASASPKLTDASGTSYDVNGVYGAVDNGGTQGLFMRFRADRPIGVVALPTGASAATYIFIVPSGTQIKSADIGGQQTPLNLSVP
jgi:Colicin V production protein